MPLAAKKNDPLSILGDGAAARSAGRTWPIPLAATEIAVEVVGGLAVVRTERRFRNAEATAIEATMTFPVPVDAALTGLRAVIDGRSLAAAAQPSKAARETYEAALDAGKTAILHEEKLRGVHMLSLGNLAPGKEATVTVTFVAPLSFAGEVPTLRIPTSVGEIFGRSPLIPSDDIEIGAVSLAAKVRVSGDGAPMILGAGLAEAELPLDGAIVVAVPAWAPAPARGRAADGSGVTVSVDRLGAGEAPLDLTVVFDRSGSTGDAIATDSGQTNAWNTMTRGLRAALGRELRPGDRVRVYDYGSDVTYVGEATGPEAVALVDRIKRPDGGTQTGMALAKAMAAHEGDVLLFTDGRSHAIDVGRLATLGRRVTAVLVGTGALDGYVGHLAGLTGGQLFAVPADIADQAALAALRSLRLPSGNPAGAAAEALPRTHRALRAGGAVEVAWGDAVPGEGPDEIGRYAAALALPLLSEAAATRVAVEHGLCTHLTSLVMVDEAGEAQQGIPATRKVPLMASSAAGALASAAGGMGVRSAFRSAAPGMMSFSASPERSMSKGLLRSSAKGLDEGWSAAPPAGSPRPRSAVLADFSDVLAEVPPPAPAPMPGARAHAFDAGVEASRIDWDSAAAAADASGLDGLPPSARVAVLRIAGLAAVVALATAMGKDVQLVALGLLASAAPASRPAGRLARRLLAGAPEDALKAARAAVGL